MLAVNMPPNDIDRRESRRKKIGVPIRYRSAQKPTRPHKTGTLYDISESGIGFYSHTQLGVADLLWVEIHLPEKKLLLEMKRNIVQCGSEYLARVVRSAKTISENRFLISCCFLSNTTSNDELKVH